MRYIHRTAFVEAQRCMRRRYWAYEWDGSGIEPDRWQRELVVGQAVHAGVAALLNSRNEHPEDAVSAAHRVFDEASLTRPMGAGEKEQVGYVLAEQQALVEALVRLASWGPVRDIVADYRVICTERDLEHEVHRDIMLAGRPDALLQNRTTGDHFIFSLKTKAEPDERAWEDAQHDDQGLSEQFLVRQLPGMDTAGVLMCWLFKGSRRELPKGSGHYIQASPLIHAWRRFDCQGNTLHATEYQRGKGWERFDTWTDMGVEAWIAKLASGVMAGDADPCLPKQWYMPAPYYRRDEDIGDWVKQFVQVESDIARRLEQGEQAFPQSRHACSYPTRCPFYQLCWGPPHLREDPVAPGSGFRRRAERTVKTNA